MLLIRYTKPNVYRCNNVRLNPGMNEVRESDWEEIRDHPLVKARIESKDIVLQQRPTDAGNSQAPQRAEEPSQEEGNTESFVLSGYTTPSRPRKSSLPPLISTP